MIADERRCFMCNDERPVNGWYDIGPPVAEHPRRRPVCTKICQLSMADWDTVRLENRLTTEGSTENDGGKKPQ